jgi:hypothetical protein
MPFKNRLILVILVFMTTWIGLVSCSARSTTPAPDVWLTPPTDVLLNYDPTQRPTPPLPSKLTQTVAERKFHYENPEGFLFNDGSLNSLMRNKEDNIQIFLQWFEHEGKTNARDFLSIMLNEEEMYKVIENPVKFSLGKYRGWLVNVQSPAIYDNGLGQIIIVDINPSTIFLATIISKAAIWESEAKPVFDRIISTLTFSK